MNTSSSSLWTQLRSVTAISEQYVDQNFFRRNGHSGQVPDEIQLLRDAVTGKLGTVSSGRRVETVCEVGFNAGHSAVAWLDGLETKLRTFDLFRWPYSNASREHIDKVYPGRVRYFKGKSADTVPRFISDLRAGIESPCDVWFVDGDHGRSAPLIDLQNALMAAADGATIIADDCTPRFAAVMRAWRTMLDRGVIADSFNRTLNLPSPVGQKGWCVGRYVKTASSDATQSTPLLSEASAQPRNVSRSSASMEAAHNGGGHRQHQQERGSLRSSARIGAEVDGPSTAVLAAQIKALQARVEALERRPSRRQ